jgi:hypothetical protein
VTLDATKLDVFVSSDESDSMCSLPDGDSAKMSEGDGDIASACGCGQNWILGRFGSVANAK